MATSLDLSPPPDTVADPATRPPAPDPSGPGRVAWLGFIVVLAASVMDLLDATIAQTAAPAIRTDLGGSFTDLEWISAGYTLAMSVVLLVGGRLGDLYGRRQVLLAGMTGFIAASVLCALAPSPQTLIGCRMLQGAVGAVMIPQGFGLIRELFGDEGQAKAFAFFGPVMGLSAVLGPIVGGGLVDLDVAGAGWRAIFLVNVPLGLGALWLGRRCLPKSPPVQRDGRIDLPSVVLATAGVFGLVYPLVEGRQLGWPAWAVALMGAAVLVLVAFGRRQRRLATQGDARRAPLVDPSVLARRAYVSGLGLVLFFIGAMGGMTLVLTVMLQVGLGFSPFGSGVALVAVPVAAIGGSITSSILLERLGRITIQIGTLTMATGLGVVELVLRSRGGQLSAWDIAAPLTLTGFGMGMIFVPMFDVILAGVLPRQLGSASGLLESVQQLGMSLGIAVVGTVLFDAVGSGHGAAAFVHGSEKALLVSIAFLVAAFGVTWWLPRHARG